MEMAGERLILAPRETVWKALNDPDILKASIPGCETLSVTSPTEMTATVAIKLGPISAKFGGRVTLSDIDPPNGYTLTGEGKGGPAGFAKGAAKVRLAEQDGGTMLHYTVDAQVGGRLAQLGARLIDTTAKMMADQFFGKFVDQVQALAPPTPVADAVAAAPAATPSDKIAEAKIDSKLLLLFAVGIAIAVAGWFFLQG